MSSLPKPDYNATIKLVARHFFHNHLSLNNVHLEKGGISMNPTKINYVIADDILWNYPEIIPNGDSKHPEGSPFSNGELVHLIVAQSSLNKLKQFETETTTRGDAARFVLGHIERLTDKRHCLLSENGKNFNQQSYMEKIYGLKAPIPVRNGSQLFSVLPIDHLDPKLTHKFKPAREDRYGQVVLTALAAQQKAPATEVILLTNDKLLAIIANNCGIKTLRYGHKRPKPYSGRRTVVVPNDLFLDFVSPRSLTLKEWEQAMPEETPLVPNEFLIMIPAEPSELNFNLDDAVRDYLHVGRFDSKQASITHLKYTRQCRQGYTPKNLGQALYAELLIDPNISLVICSGPPGTGKTYMASNYGRATIQEGRFYEMIIVPYLVEKDLLGTLPGGIDRKLSALTRPIKNAFRNYLIKEDKDFLSSNNKADKGKTPKTRYEDKTELTYENHCTNIPPSHILGLDFAGNFIICDEFQNNNPKQAELVISRLGEGGKMVVTGCEDASQIHNPLNDPFNNGLTYVKRVLAGSEYVGIIELDETEIIRCAAVADFVKRFNQFRSSHSQIVSNKVT